MLDVWRKRMKRLNIAGVFIAICCGCALEQRSASQATELTPDSPEAIIRSHYECELMEEGPSAQPLIWTFSTNGTFTCAKLTSAFYYGCKGSWVVANDGSLELSGVWTNGYTKQSWTERSVITNISIIATNAPPRVRIDKMPTKGSTVLHILRKP
jgi:hypothetical protein